ncbi:hypothetical protein, variant [Aphanomyces invadans]|uniref:Exocyst complex component Sec8 n=1 Tax=Aphanomyces invadans TaxID=157072 RepID=A0A024T8D6_9STRA|nr:hypothetical protein, variant [Aphanomyces invadans]ETV90224.1 hypothetical protein, variant [Aphanomyces invadans]|eukprot:XP_008881150.1 hypothetical protein, variant [Aphanomyces invadans]
MKASEEIDRVFLDKKFSATKYMLRYIVGASDDVRKDQLQTIGRYRSLADHEIAGVVEANYSNFNASLGKFNVISNQLQEARAGLVEVSKRSMEGKAILTAKTKNLNDLLLLKYESKKVIEVVDDIDFIDKAPSRIRQMLAAKNAPAAVDIYLRAFDLVLGDKLAVFHAIAIMRNAIIECKQLIEDHVVHEIESILYLEDVFGTFTKGLKQTVSAFQSLLAQADMVPSVHVLPSSGTSSAPSNAIMPSTSFSGNAPSKPRATTELIALVDCVKRLSRQVDVAGTIKNTRGVHLTKVLSQVASLCQGKGYYEESTFGRHAASANFQTFVQALCQALGQVVRRHQVLVQTLDHSSCTLPDVIQSVFRLLQDQLGVYITTDATSGAAPAFSASALQPNSSTGLFRFAQLQGNVAIAPPQPATMPVDSNRASVVCPSSLFHVPVVYPDLVEFSDAIVSIGKSTFSYAADMLHPYLAKVWFPRLKSEAETFLSSPTTRVPRRFELSPPLDVPFQIPDVHEVLHVVDAMFAMLETMPSFVPDVAGVVEATLLRYVEECSAVVRKICDGTLNQLETGVAATELMRSFQESDVYLTAKGKVPHQPLAKVLPTSSTTSSENDKSSTLTAPSGHNYGYSYALPTPILTTPPSSGSPSEGPPAMSKKEEMQMKEWDFEVKFKDPAFWAAPHVSKGLLFDQGKLAMLAYINMACDAVSLHTETCMQALLAKHNDADALEHVLGNVKAVSWRCSGLADECLFFLRRELRLQAFYYLTQVASPLVAQASAPPSIASPTAQATGTTAPPPISPHDCIVAWNAHLMRMKLPLAHDKIAFVWDGLDRLEATIAMHIVQYVPKLSVAGVGQMTVNLCALQQTLTALFYGHPAIPRDFFHFERAKRYFQLLTLTETELELFLMENRRAFPTDCLRAIWRVDVPTRVLTKSSVNKLDSLLR